MTIPEPNEYERQQEYRDGKAAGRVLEKERQEKYHRLALEHQNIPQICCHHCGHLTYPASLCTYCGRIVSHDPTS